jgi:sugar/nucleoside kinase (ribokinase family)
MHNPAHFEAIDYLVIGHLAKDITPEGNRLGGTAAFSALTAKALGLKVGVVTAWGEENSLSQIGSIPLAYEPASHSTTFENTLTQNGRQQIVHKVAPSIDFYQIPQAWRRAAMVHLGPIAQEVEPSLARRFPEAFLGITPQGWLREWDQEGLVSRSEWPEADYVLQNARASVISIDDVSADEQRIEEMAAFSQILVVTESKQGCRVYREGDMRSFPANQFQEVDATGAGDIFATVFFAHLQRTQNPWDAAMLANQLAGISVTRSGLDSIPTQEEIYSALVEV